jgi:hypothetical protein
MPMPMIVHCRRGRCRRLAQREREEREDAAFAVVVRAHHHDEVLDRDHPHHRPDDEREEAHHVVGVSGMPLSGLNAVFSVQRARSDVAEDDADRPTTSVRVVAMQGSGRRRGTVAMRSCGFPAP